MAKIIQSNWIKGQHSVPFYAEIHNKCVMIPLIYSPGMVEKDYYVYRNNIIPNINLIYENLKTAHERYYCVIYFDMFPYRCVGVNCSKCIFRYEVLENFSLNRLKQLMKELSILNRRRE